MGMHSRASDYDRCSKKTLTIPFGIGYIIGMQTSYWEAPNVDFAESPALLINKLAHALALDMDRRLKCHDVTVSQWAMLKQLWQQEGRSQVELQDLLGLDGATITGLVQRMTHLGLIQRKPDLSDKRVQRVFLTEKGRALEQITAIFEEEVNAHALEGFSTDERAFFIRLLMRALQNCEER